MVENSNNTIVPPPPTNVRQPVGAYWDGKKPLVVVGNFDEAKEVNARIQRDRRDFQIEQHLLNPKDPQNATLKVTPLEIDDYYTRHPKAKAPATTPPVVAKPAADAAMPATVRKVMMNTAATSQLWMWPTAIAA